MADGTMTNHADNDLPAYTPKSTAYEPELQALLPTPSSTPVSPAEKDVSSSVAPEADTAADEAVAPPSPSPASQAVDLRQVPNLSSLSDNQEMKYIGLLLDPSKITFSEEDQRRSHNRNIPPEKVFRTFHEESKTASAFMAEENQPKNRQAEGFKINPRYAFQPLWHPDVRRDLTLNRIDRHLSWPTVEDPSSYVSTFDSEYYATKRADFHANESQKIGHRISIAVITTRDLVAATVHARYKTTWLRITRRGKGRPIMKEEVHKTYLQVKIPVWVRQSIVPSDGSAITFKQLKASGAELWVSITELRASDLRLVSKKTDLFTGIMEKGHTYEWLCLGGILKEHVTCIMPFDGVATYREQGSNIIWSLNSPAHYIYDWTMKQWRLDSRLYALAVFLDWKATAARLKAREAKAALKAKQKEEEQGAMGVNQSEDGQDATPKLVVLKTDGSQLKDTPKATRKTGSMPLAMCLTS
ncbi:hypothetical protein N0V86_006511 [Didymella sp. IMI 355093]|nr:hypothetical protein N0V86_006511 [Didymella sp. IMI 355093]